MWGRAHDFWIALCFLGDAQHSVAECVQVLQALRFGGLNHQSLFDNQREVYGWRVKAVVDQTLGDIQRANAIGFLPVS
jgi:hypothetical protein